MSEGFKAVPNSWIVGSKSNGELDDCVYTDSTGKGYTVPYELYEVWEEAMKARRE